MEEKIDSLSHSVFALQEMMLKQQQTSNIEEAQPKEPEVTKKGKNNKK